MKKIVIAFIVTAALVSCNYNYSVDEDGKGNQLKKMSVKSPMTDVQLEISGDIQFNEQGTKITHISPGGFLKYYEDGKELKAENENGKITVTVYNKDGEISSGSEQGKQLLAEAIEEARKLQNKQ